MYRSYKKKIWIFVFLLVPINSVCWDLREIMSYENEQREKKEREEKERKMRQSRLENMHQFRLSVYCVNSLVRVLPPEILEHIHKMYKEIDKKEL